MKDVPSLPHAADGADLFRNAGLRFAFVVVPDTSKSMRVPKLAALNDGLQAFIDGRPADVTTLKRQDIAIIPFGPVKPPPASVALHATGCWKIKVRSPSRPRLTAI